MTQSISNNSYLIIVYGAEQDKVSVNSYDKQIANNTNNILNNALTSGSKIGQTIQNVGMALYGSPIGQNLATKYIGGVVGNANLGRINSSLYDILADGKISVAEVADDFVRSCTDILDNTALNMGFPSVSGLYNAIKPDGSGLISKDFAKALGLSSATQIKTDDEILQANNITKANILRFNLVTGDSEKWNSNLPTRKTQKGFNLVTSVQNDNIEKTFNVSIVNNSNKNIDMYDIKSKLYQLRDSKTSFKVYVNDNDVKHQDVFNNCLFSSIDVEVEGRNCLQGTLSIVPIPEWDIKSVPLPLSLSRGVNVSGSSSGSSKSSSKSPKIKNNKNLENKIKTSSVSTSNSDTTLKIEKGTAEASARAFNDVRNKIESGYYSKKIIRYQKESPYSSKQIPVYSDDHGGFGALNRQLQVTTGHSAQEWGINGVNPSQCIYKKAQALVYPENTVVLKK